MSQDSNKDKIKMASDTKLSKSGLEKREENDEIVDEDITRLSFGDYIIQFSRGNRKGNPYELIEKLYKLGQDKTMSPDERNRDLKSIVKEYME